MCVSIYVGLIGEGGVLFKKHKNQPLKFLFDWLCFSIRRFQKNVCFAKTGEGVVGILVANSVTVWIKTHGRGNFVQQTSLQ